VKPLPFFLSPWTQGDSAKLDYVTAADKLCRLVEFLTTRGYQTCKNRQKYTLQ